MRRRLLAGALVLAAAAAAWAPSLRGGFVFDDHIYIQDNPFVRDPANVRFLLDPRFYTTDQQVLAGSRPVFLASLMLDRALWGDRAAGYRLTNLLLHGATALCVAAFAAELGLGLWGAALAGALFAVQPRLGEAVCSPAFRPDILAALLAFLALFALRAGARRGRAAFAAGTAAAAFLFLLSLLAKESAALVLLAGLAAGPDAPRWSRRRLAAALLVLSAAGSVYAGYRAPRFRYELVVAPPPPVEAPAPRIVPPEAPRWQYPPSPPPWGALYVDPSLRAWTMTAETAGSLRRLFLPGRATVDRAPTVRNTWADGAVLLSGFLLCACALAAAGLRRRAPAASTGLAWTLAALAPVCGLAPLYNPVADRYLYLPMAGAAWALAAAVLALARRAGPRARPAALTLAALLLVPWLAAARRRASEWTSDKTLFFAEPGGPQSPRVAYNRALVMLAEGRVVAGEAHLREAVRVHPGFAEAWTKLGALYEGLGSLDRARQCYAEGAGVPAPSPLPLFAFGRFLERRGEKEAAAGLYRAALLRDRGFAPAGEALAALGAPGPKR